jgi:hypothetical protein
MSAAPGHDPFYEGGMSILRRPKAVRATAGAAVVGRLIIGVGRRHLAHEAVVLDVAHSTQDGVTAFAD